MQRHKITEGMITVKKVHNIIKFVNIYMLVSILPTQLYHDHYLHRHYRHILIASQATTGRTIVSVSFMPA